MAAMAATWEMVVTSETAATLVAACGSAGFKGGRTVRVLPSVRIVRWHHPHWRPQVIVRTGYVNTYAALRPVTSYAVSQPATCTCLTKEYLEDGSVLFKDTCTKEMVQNPPPADQTAQAPTQ